MTTKNKGWFSEIDPAKQRKLASIGGKLAHKLGLAHEWTREEAQAAGRKGALAGWRNKRKHLDFQH